jgi:hypothetical protein
MKTKTTVTKQAKPTTKPNTNSKALILTLTALLAIIPAAKSHAGTAPAQEGKKIDNALHGNPTMWYLKQITKAQDDFKQIFETTLVQWQGAKQSADQIFEIAKYAKGADVFAIYDAVQTIDALGEQLEQLLGYAAGLGELANNIQDYNQEQLDEIAISISNITVTVYAIANEIQALTSDALDQAVTAYNAIPRRPITADVIELPRA